MPYVPVFICNHKEYCIILFSIDPVEVNHTYCTIPWWFTCWSFQLCSYISGHLLPLIRKSTPFSPIAPFEEHGQLIEVVSIYILTAENLGVCFSFFLENYLMDFSQTLPFSSLYCSQGYKQKSEMCCYFCLATKCEICQNLPVLAPIYGHF